MKKQRKIWACLLLLTFVLQMPAAWAAASSDALPGAAAAAQDKLDHLPDLFRVSFLASEREEDGGKRFIRKETLETTNPAATQAIAQAADRLDEKLAPLIVPEPNGNAKNYSRLDIEANYTITGHSWLSVLLIGRVSQRQKQIAVGMETLTFDLETGSRVMLTDIFPQDSPAWSLLAERARRKLESVFPGEERDKEAINALMSDEAFKTADFTLSGGELTLHFPAQAVGLEAAGLIHVRFYYPELQGMMAPEAARQTDNRHWKMVAITCDDGPNFANTTRGLKAFREGGARVTFFVAGNVVNEGRNSLRRQYDANHLIANHSFSHKSGYSLKPESMMKQVTDTSREVEIVTGEGTTLFRAPGGLWPPWQKAAIGLPIIQWSVDAYDFGKSKQDSVLRIVQKYIQHGDVLLMHDDRKLIADSAPLVTEYLRENGYLMVTVEELAWAEGVTLQPNVVYARFDQGRYDERPNSILDKNT